MKSPVLLVLSLAMLLAAGCGPKEPPPAPVPQKSRAELQRAEFFDEAVASDPAVTWKPSGLGVKIVAPGQGANPELGDRVRVNYVGRLKDGTVFDETPAGQPREFVLHQLVPGLVTGIGLLKPGGKATYYIPPSLGYGSMKAGKVPPVSGLIFEVELVGVNPQ